MHLPLQALGQPVLLFGLSVVFVFWSNLGRADICHTRKAELVAFFLDLNVGKAPKAVSDKVVVTIPLIFGVEILGFGIYNKAFL